MRADRITGNAFSKPGSKQCSIMSAFQVVRKVVNCCRA